MNDSWLEDNDNPTTFWDKGSLPKKFHYTYQNIADITGLSVATLRNYAHIGKFDPYSLKSVIQFCSYIDAR